VIHLDSARIQGRRRFIFRYLSQQLSATEMHPIINEAYPCSLATVHRDIRNMRDWLPGLMNIREGDGDQAFARLIGMLRDAQERASQLSYTADNSNAMVGALRALALAVKAEADLRMDTGGIVRTPFRLEHLRTDIELKGLDEDAVSAIVQNFMDDEARRLRMNDGESKPVDSSKNKDGETHPSPLNGLPKNGLSEWEDTSKGGKMAGGYSVKR